MSRRYELLEPFLFGLDPESGASAGARRARRRASMPRRRRSDPRLRRRLLGLDFPNPLGIAAGFDKNAEVPDALLGARLRLRRGRHRDAAAAAGQPAPAPLPPARATGRIINRLGFNNEGHDGGRARGSPRRPRRGIVGVNIGANKDSRRPRRRLCRGRDAASPASPTISTVNVSSPNTPGLRDLQGPAALGDAARSACVAARDGADRRVPLLLKIAPDLDETALAAIAETVAGAGIEGMIVANTTRRARRACGPPSPARAGGLSGRPLFRRSTAMLATAPQAGRHGSSCWSASAASTSAETAFAKIARRRRPRAALHRPGLSRSRACAREIVTGLPRLLDQRGHRPSIEASRDRRSMTSAEAAEADGFSGLSSRRSAPRRSAGRQRQQKRDRRGAPRKTSSAIHRPAMPKIGASAHHTAR